MRSEKKKWEFSQLLNKVMTDRKVTSKQLAHDLDMGYDAFRSRFREGATSFSPDEVRDILGVLPDPQLVNYLLRRSPYVGVKRHKEAQISEETENLKDEAIEMATEASDALRAVTEALKDRRVCHKDLPKLRQELEKAEAAVVQVRYLVEKVAE